MSITSNSKMLPKYARTVIVGGGVIGSSMLYHLSLHNNWKDVVLLEQGVLTCGTTWHAAGLIGQMRNTSAEIVLSKYGSELYSSLEKKGYPTSWKKCGSVSLSSSSERLIALKRNLGRARSFGIEAEIISGKEAYEKWPYIDSTDINAALWLPNDGTAVSSDCTSALAKAAKDNGAQIFEHTEVKNLKIQNNIITGVVTESGEIEAEVVVICTGLWTRYLINNTPLHPCYHMYIVTEPHGVPGSLPILRDLDGLLYAREWSGGLCVGGFELHAKPCFVNEKAGVLQFHLFDEDWEQFDPIIKNSIKRIPNLNKVGIRQLLNGPESFTSDNAYILGESPYIKNLFMACGFNSSGIASAGGAGLALSEWIINGRPTRDLWTVDPRRFAKFHGTKQFLLERVTETLGLHYSLPYPFREYNTARNLRQSNLYEKLKSKGALFGNKFGWERPNVFLDPDKKIDDKILHSWKFKKEIDDKIKVEHLHTREKVSIFDQSSFSKYILSGPDALKSIQMLTCNNLDVDINKVVYTPMLNEKGGYEADITITRIEEDEFLIISPTSNSVRDISRIKRFLKENKFAASIIDITSSMSVLGLMGPKSRELLEKVSEENLSNGKFPFSTSKEISIGMAFVRVSRITYVGCLGFEIYIPTEMTNYVYDYLFKAGEEFELKDAGYYAIESLRIEKGYRAWAHELKTDISPIEAGLSFTINWDKPEFVGKQALLTQKSQGVKKRIISLTIEPEEGLFMLGDEPVFRNKELVGYVTSTRFGYSLNKWVCLAVIQNNEKYISNKWIENGEFQIEIFQKMRNARQYIKPPYDSLNKEVLN